MPPRGARTDFNNINHGFKEYLFVPATFADGTAGTMIYRREDGGWVLDQSTTETLDQAERRYDRETSAAFNDRQAARWAHIKIQTALLSLPMVAYGIVTSWTVAISTTGWTQGAAVLSLIIEGYGAQATVRVILTGEEATLLGVEGLTLILMKSGMEEGKARATATVFYLMAAVGAGIKTGNAYDNLDKSKLPKGIDDTIAKLQDDINKTPNSIPSNQVDKWIDDVERALDDTPLTGIGNLASSFEKVRCCRFDGQSNSLNSSGTGTGLVEFELVG